MTAGEGEEAGGASNAGALDFGSALAGLEESGFSETDKPEAAADSQEASPTSGGEPVDHSAMIMGLPVMMKVVLGSAKMPVATLAKLARGSVVKLDKMVGDPVDILVNGRLIARGEVVVLNEGTSRFGIVLTEVGNLTPTPK